MSKEIPLSSIAYARSGDKGSKANIGVIARNPEAYAILVKQLTEEKVRDFFKGLGVSKVTRYRLDNLEALNFVLDDVLVGGGNRSLRTDAQGKALGQALLTLCLPEAC
jgi:hypothetical protein